MPSNYRFEIKSDLSTANRSIKKIIEDFASFISDENLLFNLRLVLTELVTNGIIHGNKNDIDKKVFLEIVYNNEKVLIKVSDQGDGIKGGYKLNTDKLNKSGRGLFLVYQLCDDFKIEGCKVFCSLKL